MQILALPLCFHHVWCGLALFYVDAYGVWRVQLPRGKPVKLAAAPRKNIELLANDKFVYARIRYTTIGWLFARDGSLLHHTEIHRPCQLTGSGLAVYDHDTRSATTWPGGQSHAVDSIVHGLAVSSTNLATPVFILQISHNTYEYLTYVDGKVVPLGADPLKWVYPGCPTYRVNGRGIYVRAGYRAGLLALWRGGLPKELRWHIMDY
jgi:hypothetical protein